MNTMSKVVVFDSGLGSLSIVQAIRKTTKANIIYFADQKYYPYGKKTPTELRKIIQNTIKSLKKEFSPDVMIIGSNTPSLLFPDLFLDNDRLIGVLPPLLLASKKTKTNSIAVLGTTATIKSHELDSYIHNNISKKCSVCKIDATELIDLVESAEFIHNKQYCIKIIKNKLSKLFEQRNVDVVTLSSTHLPFLLKIFHKVFPQILFLDPAMDVANQLIRNNFFKESTRSSLQIFSSKNPLKLQKNLEKMQVNKSVKFFEC